MFYLLIFRVRLPPRLYSGNKKAGKPRSAPLLLDSPAFPLLAEDAGFNDRVQDAGEFFNGVCLKFSVIFYAGTIRPFGSRRKQAIYGRRLERREYCRGQ